MGRSGVGSESVLGGAGSFYVLFSNPFWERLSGFQLPTGVELVMNQFSFGGWHQWPSQKTALAT